MSTYVIGDIQGCFQAFKRLLDVIQFDESQDTLWFTGDLVNRGPDSLSVLRFIKSLGRKHHTVLGNHDLHLLAVYYANARLSSEDTLNEVLHAEDAPELMRWLLSQPLAVYDESTHALMTHAGVPPTWNLSDTLNRAKEVSEVLQSAESVTLLSQLYGNTPIAWDESLQGIPRWRCIINYLTRMRWCDQSGQLDFTYKGGLKNPPAHLVPWFELPSKCDDKLLRCFGHWAALMGDCAVPNVIALDTGCVWGGSLTALRVEDRERFCVNCK